MNDSTTVTNVCKDAHVLRRQGIPFGDPIEQISDLFSLEMDEEREDLLGGGSVIPDLYRWHRLKALDSHATGADRKATGGELRTPRGCRDPAAP